MKMTRQELMSVFYLARQEKARYVFLLVVASGVKEVIAIPFESLDSAEQFYVSSFNETLVRNSSSTIRITGCTYGDANELMELV